MLAGSTVPKQCRQFWRSQTSSLNLSVIDQIDRKRFLAHTTVGISGESYKWACDHVTDSLGHVSPLNSAFSQPHVASFPTPPLFPPILDFLPESAFPFHARRWNRKHTNKNSLFGILTGFYLLKRTISLHYGCQGTINFLGAFRSMVSICNHDTEKRCTVHRKQQLAGSIISQPGDVLLMPTCWILHLLPLLRFVTTLANRGPAVIAHR